MKWIFTADEFAYVWRETGLDRHSPPLSIVTSPRTEDAAAQLESAIAARHPRGGDADLSVALRVAARPSTVVSLVTETVRSSARALNGIGVVITQRGTAIEVSMMREKALPGSVADTVADVPAGRMTAMTAPARELTDDRAFVVLEDATHTAMAARMRALLAAPRTGAGHVAVQRLADSDAPPNRQYLGWIDVTGDGRYLVGHAADVRIAPANRDDIRAELARLTAGRSFIQ